MTEEQESTWRKCPNCNTTMVTFSPSLEFEVCEPCGAIHPKFGVECHLYDCHDGSHTHYKEDVIVWQ